MQERTTIAIIGGGCSGTLVALNLLRNNSSVRVHLIEPRGIAGTGLAYSTDCEDHLLNIPVRGMSALPDCPMDFVRWLEAYSDSVVDPDGFAPRWMFGRYVADLLETACSEARPRSILVRHQAEAVNIEREEESAMIHLTDGKRLEADFAVLALGHFPRVLKSVESAWTRGALDARDPDSQIALVGSGLTAVDVFVALRAKGHRGVVHMISRRGLVPHGHVSTHAPYVPLRWKASTLRELLREIRERCKHDTDWREVMCSLRGVTNELWLALSPQDRARFFRHAKAYWDVHRHRMAPQIAEIVAKGRQSGDLRVHAGRVKRITRSGHGLQIDLRLRSQQHAQLCVQRIINCTGSEQDYRCVDSPLLRSLFEKGWLTSNALGLGVRTLENGTVMGRDGTIVPWLYAVGPMRIGGLLETTAVPEIRLQAAELAAMLRKGSAVAA